jgi:hypothetical protein
VYYFPLISKIKFYKNLLFAEMGNDVLLRSTVVQDILTEKLFE